MAAKLFARVNLKPSSTFAGPDSPVQPPLLYKHSSESAADRTHDPLKDTITVLLDPALAKTIDAGLGRGMGLRGIFVQVLPGSVGETGDLQGVGQGETFWYIEKLSQTLPSFWTEKCSN